MGGRKVLLLINSTPGYTRGMLTILERASLLNTRVKFLPKNVTVGITRGGGTAIAISSSGSWLIRVCLVYQKRKKGVVKVGLSIGP